MMISFERTETNKRIDGGCDELAKAMNMTSTPSCRVLAS
jgi:hypothetical protein